MAKKNKKNRPPDFDPNQRKRERIEARRQAKAEAMERQRKAARRERIVRRIGIVVVLLLALLLFMRGGAPDAIAGHEIEHYSTSNGNPAHVDFDVTYDSSPPVSGQHRPQAAPCGIHGAPIEDELFVHTLEHGVVAVLYDPTLPVDEIRRIEKIVGSFPSYTLSAPYAGEMKTPIAVVTWAHIMRLDEVDERAIREFIDVFRQGGDAPEAGDIPCPNDADDEFQPATPAPDASPGAASPPPASEEPDDRAGDETPAP
jgi:hypothetical protein